MKLYIMRHGDSPSAMEAGVASDFDRPLASVGRENARRSAQYLKDQGAAPARILVSPLLRAQQTAQEASPIVKGPDQFETYEPLSNRIGGMDLCRRIEQDHSDDQEILIIGHQPQLGEAANFLTGQYFDLKPAGIIAVNIETPGKGRLLWSANPADLS